MSIETNDDSTLRNRLNVIIAISAFVVSILILFFSMTCFADAYNQLVDESISEVDIISDDKSALDSVSYDELLSLNDSISWTSSTNPDDYYHAHQKIAWAMQCKLSDYATGLSLIDTVNSWISDNGETIDGVNKDSIQEVRDNAIGLCNQDMSERIIQACNSADQAYDARISREKKEQEAREAAEREAEEKEAARKEAEQQAKKSNKSHSTSYSSQSNATESSSKASSSSSAAYDWYTNGTSQASINNGNLVIWATDYYAADIRSRYGTPIRNLSPGDVVRVNGRTIVIDGSYYTNYHSSSLEETRAAIGYGPAFQTCLPSGGGNVVIKYGHYE